MLGPMRKMVRGIGEATRCGPAASAAYAVNVGMRLGAVAKARSLVEVDRAMRGDYAVTFHGQRLRVPAGRMDDCLPDEDSPTFAGVREMLARDIYLSGFSRAPQADAVVDLGANRGLFALVARSALGCKTYIGVEANAVYLRAFEALADANGLSQRQRIRETVFVAAADVPPTHVTLTSLLTKHGVDRVGFLKCDIEGAENELFLGDGRFADRVDAMALELHPDLGARNAEIGALLSKNGFALRFRDDDGHAAEAARATYLFAALDPGVLR